MDATPARPVAILVTGAPGSGKSTLARELSRRLRLPHLARDDVRTGLYFTRGAWSEHPGPVPSAEESVEAFLTIVEAILEAGASCIIEYVFRERRPEDLARVLGRADGVVLHTRCDASLERFAARNRVDPLVTRPPVLAALGFETVEDHTTAAIARMVEVAGEMQERFDLPTLVVDTTDGYDPGLEQIVGFVTSR